MGPTAEPGRTRRWPDSSSDGSPVPVFDKGARRAGRDSHRLVPRPRGATVANDANMSIPTDATASGVAPGPDPSVQWRGLAAFRSAGPHLARGRTSRQGIGRRSRRWRPRPLSLQRTYQSGDHPNCSRSQSFAKLRARRVSSWALLTRGLMARHGAPSSSRWLRSG